MAIYGDNVLRGHCRHGAKKVNGRGTCIHETCDYFFGFGLDDPRRYFGAASSSAEAHRLSLSPAEYKTMRARAVELNLLLV